MGIEMFDFKGHDVHVVFSEQGEPRWVASDVARALGYETTTSMTRNIRDRHKGVQTVDTLGGPRWMTTLTEAGLYSAILRSRSEMAEEFQDWVTDEVLPSIPRPGGHVSKDEADALKEAIQRKLDDLRLVNEIRIREAQDRAVNVYDYIIRRTGDHDLASRWTLQLAEDTGQAWPYIFSDGDGLRADPADLDEAWSHFGYSSMAFESRRSK